MEARPAGAASFSPRAVAGPLRAALAAVLGAVVSGALASCGASADGTPVRRAVQRFFVAVGARDGVWACSMLAPAAAESVESGGSHCAEEILQLHLTGGRVTSVSVWGDRAQVVTTGDTVFLAHFPQGWRVTAAGCVKRPKGPYRCDVEA